MLKLLLIPVILYAAICLAAYLFQDKALFPTAAARPHGPLPPGAERVAFDAADGTHLVGLHVRPRQGAQGAPVILGFGGNAWNADNAAEYLADLYPRADVVAFHYRGYPPSAGSPGAAAMLGDAIAVHDHVAALFPGRRIVAVGFSIGSGLAARLARERPIAGAILVTPFDSLTAVAAGHYPWLPVRWLFRNKIEAARDVAAARVPIAIIVGGADRLIPAERSEGLRRAARTLVFDRTIRGAGHNDIYARSDFQLAAREALDALLRPR